MKHWPLILVLAVLLMAARSERAVTLQAGDTVHCTADALALTSAVDARCVAFTPTPTATATAVAAPTATSTPTAIATATGTPTLVATATATVVPTLPASMPLCPSHDPTVYHALIDTARGCHYDHEHHDDPNDPASVALFGVAGAWWGGSQSISYPWQTFNNNAPCFFENICKHNGYKVMVRHGACVIPASDATGCLTDFREQIHFIAGATDFLARNHSFEFEARGCINNVCGTIQTGGWMDYGCLAGISDVAPTYTFIPLPSDPAVCGFNSVREHGFDNAGNTAHAMVWYAGTNTPVSLAILTSRMFGPLDHITPTNQLFFCPLFDCEYNGSSLQAHVNIVNLTNASVYDPDGNGLVDFNGFTDRYQNVVPACAPLGVDCVPLVIHHLPLGNYQYRDDTQGVLEPTYDTSPVGQHWIAFPN